MSLNSCVFTVFHSEAVDAWASLFLGVVRACPHYLYLAVYKGVSRVTVGAVIAAVKCDASQLYTPGDDEVQLVPLAQSRVSTRYLMLILSLEESVGHTQAGRAPQFQQPLSHFISPSKY